MSKISVLLVDDESSFREQMNRWLQRREYEVEAVATAQAAIDKVWGKKGKFDVALIDRMLDGGLDGIELMQQILSKFPDISVIIITGWGDRESGLKALRSGAYRYISKPFDPEEIDILIQSIVKYKEVQKRLEFSRREREWLKALLELTRAMQSQTGDKKQVLISIAEAAKALVHADHCTIRLVDQHGGISSEMYTTLKYDKKKLKYHFKKEAGSLCRIILEKQAVEYITDTELDERIDPTFKNSGVRSIIGVPIGQHGILYVYGMKPDQFIEQQITILNMLAQHASIALQNTLFFEEKEKQLQELNQLREVSNLISKAEKLTGVLYQITTGVLKILGADSAAIRPYNLPFNRFEEENVIIVGIENEEVIKDIKKTHKGGTSEKIMKEGCIFVHNVYDPEYKIIKPKRRTLYKKIGLKSFYGVALKVDDEPVGVLYVNFNLQRDYSKEDEASLRAFAAEAALAIKKVRLYQQVHTFLEHLELTANFMQLTNVETVLQGIVDNVKKALNCDVVNLYRYDDKKKEIIGDPFTIGVIKEAYRFNIIKPADPIARVLEVGEYYANNAIDDPIMKGNFVDREKILSSAAISLKIGKKITDGIMFVDYKSKHNFTEDEKNLIRSFAAQAAIAIRNANLFYKEKKYRIHFQNLYKAGKVIAESVNKNRIINLLLDKAIEITETYGEKAKYANLQTFVPETNELVLTHARPSGELANLRKKNMLQLSLSDGVDGRFGIVGKALNTKKTQWIQNVNDYPDYIKYHNKTRSKIAVPLVADKDRVLGILNVEHEKIDGLDNLDKEMLEMLATQAVIAIQKAEQFEELNKTQKQLTARTTVAWMGMASSAWRHETNKYASSIADNIYLIKKELKKANIRFLKFFGLDLSSIKKYLDQIKKLVKFIRETPITAPLSTEEGVESLQVNSLLKERITRIFEGKEISDISIQWDLKLPDDTMLRVSREWLRRAIDQLVNNSIRAMDRSKKKILTIKSFRKNNLAKIQIIDTGPGIPKKILEKLFQEPIPKKKGEKGSGIGLLLVQLILQTYDGDIKVVSTGEGGTKMEISFPIEK